MKLMDEFVHPFEPALRSDELKQSDNCNLTIEITGEIEYMGFDEPQAIVVEGRTATYGDSSDPTYCSSARERGGINAIPNGGIGRHDEVRRRKTKLTSSSVPGDDDAGDNSAQDRAQNRER